jgi:hypothetical protein
MHAPALGQQHAATRRDRVAPVEQMPECAVPRVTRVLRLENLRQLLRITEQDDAAGARPCGDEVCHGKLTLRRARRRGASRRSRAASR